MTLPPLWSGLLSGLVILSGTLGVAAYGVWFERKFAARMQSRPGPTEVGPAGLLQPIADLLKLIQKECVVPTAADAGMFRLAPILVIFAALLTLAVVPFGPGLMAADLHLGLLFVIAFSSLMVIPVWMTGWASNNKYAILGGMRAAAQSISYEIPLLLAAMVPVVLAGSFRLGDIVAAQEGGRWFAFWPPGPGLLAFGLFMLASLAEANRIPFDIPEAESELVAGVTTEYSGMQFGVIYLAEYVHTFLTSLLAAALFLGGWSGPGPDGIHWMMAKALALFAGIFWIRWSYLRFRSDQLMAMCWKLFVPLGLLLVMASALWVHLR